MAGIMRFEEIEAWKTARELTKLIYSLTEQGAFQRDFGLKDQIRRASVSVMSNIAEGFESRTDAQFLNYLGHARASAGEVRAQLYVAFDQNYILQPTFDEAFALAEKSARQIAAFMAYLEKHPHPRRIGEEIPTYAPDLRPSTFDSPHIRKAHRTDSPALATLIRELGLFAHINAEDAEVTAARVSDHLAFCLADDSHAVYVAENEAGEIMGYVSVHWLPYLILPGLEGYVSELFIAESARGQGAGAKLLEVVEADARQHGCARLMLLNMRQRESYQRGFYAKHGWEERADAANFIRKLT